MFAMFAILLQVSLGALTIWSARAVTPATLHVSGGSLVLVTMFTLALRAQRVLLPRAVTSTSRRVAATVAVEPVKMEIA